MSSVMISYAEWKLYYTCNFNPLPLCPPTLPTTDPKFCLLTDTLAPSASHSTNNWFSIHPVVSFHPVHSLLFFSCSLFIQDAQNLKEASPTTSSSTVKDSGEPEPEGGKLSKTQQLKKVFKEYGGVGVSFHIGISLMSLGMFYLLVSR